MNTTRKTAAWVVTLISLLTVAGALAHEATGRGTDAPQGEQRMGDGMMGRGMMGGGMMGGGAGGEASGGAPMGEGMTAACERMMGGASPHGLPQLPPGNEALQFQMHAEMLQAMGEIAARYADRIKGAR